MRRRGMTALVASLGLFTLALAFWAPAGTAKPPTCLITNGSTEYATLQAAVNAASAGATLEVRGVCTGKTHIEKALTITGVLDKDFQKPTLDGGGVDRVLEIYAPAGSYETVAVMLNSLTIQGGRATGFGGGIWMGHTGWNYPRVYLKDSVVRDNTAAQGGGIYNPCGVLDLENTTVTGNSAIGRSGDSVLPGWGGGMFLVGPSSWTFLTDSAVTANHASDAGGGIANFGPAMGGSSTVTLDGTTKVTSNDAPQGGGIFNSGRQWLTWSGEGVVILEGDAKIAGNTATEGGGVYNGELAYLTLNGNSRISRNQALTYGGGIYNSLGSVIPNCIAGVNVRDNSPDEIYAETPLP